MIHPVRNDKHMYEGQTCMHIMKGEREERYETVQKCSVVVYQLILYCLYNTITSLYRTAYLYTTGTYSNCNVHDIC